jgi:hypothetical protein
VRVSGVLNLWVSALVFGLAAGAAGLDIVTLAKAQSELKKVQYFY